MLRAVNVQLLLSIPLNGFLIMYSIMYSRVQFERLRRAFNSIEWIHGFYSRKLSFVDEELSIPLNGFSGRDPSWVVLERTILRLSIPLNGFLELYLKEQFLDFQFH